MSEIKANLGADFLAEIQNVYVRPLYLIQIEYANGVLHLSDGAQFIWDGKTFIEGGATISPISTDGEGDQEFNLVLSNLDNSASALALNDLVEDVTVTVWKTYIKTDGNLATPKLHAIGVTDKHTINDSFVTINVVTSKASSEFAPNEYFGRETGFNHLPVPGTVLSIGNERYMV